MLAEKVAIEKIVYSHKGRKVRVNFNMTMAQLVAIMGLIHQLSNTNIQLEDSMSPLNFKTPAGDNGTNIFPSLGDL